MTIWAGRWVLSAAAIQAPLAFEDAGAQQSLLPATTFIQEGWAGHTRSTTAGAIWDWPSHWSLGAAQVSGYWEGSVSRWSYEAEQDRNTAWLAQVGLIPVFRFRPRGAMADWFFDLGVGLTLTTRLYQTDRRRFSTRFNFGDHLALGRSFGSGDRHEIALRAEHFSNGGVREPNPGINFLQLRYSYRFE